MPYIVLCNDAPGHLQYIVAFDCGDGRPTMVAGPYRDQFVACGCAAELTKRAEAPSSRPFCIAGA
jgi:hypothetical protein